MSISTYSELQTAISEWMDRSDLTGNAADFITLAEARLNRKLDAVEVDATISGTSGSRRIDVSALKVIEPLALWITEDGEERLITPKVDGTFPYETTPAAPRYYGMEGDSIDFDTLLDQAYSFRFRYRGRFALSDAAPTNYLLTNHPDVYLAASLVWGGVFIKDSQSAQGFKALLDEFMMETSNELSQKKRARYSPSTEIYQLVGRSVYSGRES